MKYLLPFLTLLCLGQCLDQLLSRQEIETSINRTIEEVERMVDVDPSLPRLSRSQIVDILYNITAQDIDSLEDSVEKVRSDYQRALMVVLPYNSKDARDNDLKDLYTKPPMVQIIPDTNTMLPFASIQEESPSVVSSDPLDNHISTSYPEELTNDFPVSQEEYKNHRTSYSDVKKESEPERFNLNLVVPTTTTTTTKEKTDTTLPTLWSLIRRDKITTSKPKLEVIYSTSVTQKPTTKIVTTTLKPVEFIPTMPTTKTLNILTSDQWRYFEPPSTTTKRPTVKPTVTIKTFPTIRATTQQTTTEKTEFPKYSRITKKPQPFLPTMISDNTEISTLSSYQLRKSSKTTTKEPEFVTFDIIEDEMMGDESAPPIFVTPMSSASLKINSSSSTKINATKSPVTTKTTVRQEVASLLATIGLRPKNETHNGSVKNNSVPQGIFATNFEIPQSNNIAPTQTSAITTELDSPSILTQNTFDGTQTDVRKGVNNLSQDVQLLFQRFGLQTSDKQRTTTTTTDSPLRVSFKTNSWNNFKPLPRSEVKDEKMRDFLASFGLGIANNRTEKSLKNSEKTENIPSIIDAVPGNMKAILENIGLITRSKIGKKVEPTTTTTTTTTTESTTKLHIFKPHETIFNDDKQKMKINELLDTVRLVQEGKARISDVRKVANDLLTSTKSLQGGPDPMSLEEILRIYNDDIRNEVKRQESKTNAPDTATSESPETTTLIMETSKSPIKSMDSAGASSDTDSLSSESDGKIVNSGLTTTTESSSLSTEGPNFDDLSDSFGGSTAEPDPVLPTPRKSGLYFLVDWNSFLEVGEEDKDKVNLRFAPKVGDRTRFIPVVVP